MRKTALLLLVTAVGFLFAGCLSEPEFPQQELDEYSFEEVLLMDIAGAEQIRLSIPYMIDETNSSFEIKDITDPEDKQKVREFLESISVTEVEEAEEKMGFDALIEIKNGDDLHVFIVFNEELMLVNNIRIYISDKDIGPEAVLFYESLDYIAEKLE